MGLFDRIRNFRTETASFLPSTGTNKNAPPTFVPDIIQSKVWVRDEKDHLEIVSQQDPVAHYIVYKLAENALDDWFKFVDENGKEIMQNVQEELKRINAKRVLTQVLSLERCFGYSFLYTGKNRYVPQTPEGGRIASLHAFSPKECVVVDYNEYGEPSKMRININVGIAEDSTQNKRIELNAEDFIFINTRPLGRGYKGRSAIYSVWDMLTYLRYIYHAMTFYDMKIGQGLFAVFTKRAISDTDKSKMDTGFSDISVKRSLVLDGSKIDKVEFIGAGAGGTDFEAHIRACLNMIAAGTGIPVDVLIGVTAGAITGSEVNIKSLFATINQIQASIEPYIRDLVEKMGYNRKYSIAWNARYAHDEEEKSKIAMNNAQTLAIRSNWLTINEIRAEEGLPPIEGGDELKTITTDTMQTPEEKEQTRNPEGVNL